jgi:HAMP domain-containing protein
VHRRNRIAFGVTRDSMRFKAVFGTCKDLTESVNTMASNLTDQVRNIAEVTTAVAKGDLTTRITVDARGEILETEEHR